MLENIYYFQNRTSLSVRQLPKKKKKKKWNRRNLEKGCLAN